MTPQQERQAARLRAMLAEYDGAYATEKYRRREEGMEPALAEHHAHFAGILAVADAASGLGAGAWDRLRREFTRQAHHVGESHATVTISLPATDWPEILRRAPR